MFYKIVLSLFLGIIFSQNVVCSAKKSVRFDTVHEESVTTNFMNVVASTQEMEQHFQQTRAQYIAENYISNQANIVMKQSVKQARSEQIKADLQARDLALQYYCLSLQHPECVTWKVKAFIKK